MQHNFVCLYQVFDVKHIVQSDDNDEEDEDECG